jgi:hypothetical protein
MIDMTDVKHLLFPSFVNSQTAFDVNEGIKFQLERGKKMVYMSEQQLYCILEKKN